MNALSAMPSSADLTGLVAFADDSPSAKAALETVLRRAGFAVAGFDCADDLIESLDGIAPRAIILDLEMPGMSGFEAFCEIRRRFPMSSDVPVLFFSAHYDADTRAQAEALGAADFISKDSSPMVVIEQLNRVLGVTRAISH
jgi:DNA-binding response OmpR family regulator